VIARLTGLLASALAATACGHAMFAPPAGPGVPVANPEAAWTEATRGCGAARTYSAAMRVSGRAGEQRIWPLALDVAVAVDRSIYMGATVAGRSIFVLAGTAGQATLWLRREERSVTAPPADILEAILGIPLPPERLVALFTGCVTTDQVVSAASQRGRVMTIDTTDARVHLERRDSGWQTRAGESEGFVVEFARESSSFPQKIWIRSAAGREPRVAIDVTVSDLEVNGAIPPRVFSPPAGAAAAQPMTIEELRAAGPLKHRGNQAAPSR
jgi:hypothetical protein